MWFEDAIFYHIYPLGALGAPRENDGGSEPVTRLRKLWDWIPAMERVGANALYLGPVFESERHGYDTVDYFTVDRRLGTNDDLGRFSAELKGRGISLVLDAVFNHVGRSHPIVKDVVENGPVSRYARWIVGYDPSHPGPGGLPFSYEGWAGHYDLVKLDTALAEVREYLISVALRWIEEFDIAGLRLDAADCLSLEFTRELGARCRERKRDFFLLGEAVHGDRYAPMMAQGGLHSVTNYEAFKGLWSSYNDRNYHEISWTLDRLFGDGGLCKGRPLYSFVDNHDVDRLASTIRGAAGLYPVYGLLFAMPGIPSIYYGSEFGVGGQKRKGDDGPLRPELDPGQLSTEAPHPDLVQAISRFAAARRATPSACRGSYKLLRVESEGIAFLRGSGDDSAVIVVNGSSESRNFQLKAAELEGREYTDFLEPSYRTRFDHSGFASVPVFPHWVRWFLPVKR